MKIIVDIVLVLTVKLVYNRINICSEVDVVALCSLCPRECGIDRSIQMGYCKSRHEVVLSKVGLHKWEEPCISHKNGSGTIFFAGCNMGCVFCQNHEISSGIKGKPVSVDTLCDEMLKLCDIGADNINLVTPTHYADKILEALKTIKHRLQIPVFYNTSSYEKIETLRSLEGYIDIYLPDLKYYSSNLSGKFSNCKDYFPVALSAVKEMLRQTGKAKFDDEGKLLCGTVVRHLVLPNCYKDSIKIFDELEKEVDTQKVVVSVMCQYFPTNRAGEFSELSRKTTTLEYMKVVERVRKINFAQGFIQDKSSANEIYVPIFDY